MLIRVGMTGFVFWLLSLSLLFFCLLFLCPSKLASLQLSTKYPLQQFVSTLLGMRALTKECSHHWYPHALQWLPCNLDILANCASWHNVFGIFVLCVVDNFTSGGRCSPRQPITSCRGHHHVGQCILYSSMSSALCAKISSAFKLCFNQWCSVKPWHSFFVFSLL